MRILTDHENYQVARNRALDLTREQRLALMDDLSESLGISGREIAIAIQAERQERKHERVSNIVGATLFALVGLYAIWHWGRFVGQGEATRDIPQTQEIY